MSAATPRMPVLPRIRRLVAAAFALLALLQLGTILWLIWGVPVQVPWQDELFHYLFFMRARAGTATWADYWQPLGGVHRTVFPRLLYVLAINATAWDRRIWLTINPLLVAGTVAALAATARQTTGSRRLAAFLLAPLGALLFALSQYSQWLQPFGLQFALVLCCGAMALWALTARPSGWPQLVLAVGVTWVASWSGLHGLALWAALLPLVLLAGWRKALVWLACAAAVIGGYAVDLPRQGVAKLAPGELVTFVLTNLGAPLGTLQNPATRAQFWDHTTVHLEQRWALWIGAASVLLLIANVLAAWRAGGIWPRQPGAVPAVVLPGALRGGLRRADGAGAGLGDRERGAHRAVSIVRAALVGRAAGHRRAGRDDILASARLRLATGAGGDESGRVRGGDAALRAGQSGERVADARFARAIAPGRSLRPRSHQCAG